MGLSHCIIDAHSFRRVLRGRAGDPRLPPVALRIEATNALLRACAIGKGDEEMVPFGNLVQAAVRRHFWYFGENAMDVFAGAPEDRGAAHNEAVNLAIRGGVDAGSILVMARVAVSRGLWVLRRSLALAS